MSEKKKKKTVYLQTVEKCTLYELACKISEVVEHDDIAFFVAALERFYESWEVTESLIRHFKALEVKYNDCLDEEEKGDLSSKSLIKNDA